MVTDSDSSSYDQRSSTQNVIPLRETVLRERREYSEHQSLHRTSQIVSGSRDQLDLSAFFVHKSTESLTTVHSRRSHRKSRYGCRNCKNGRRKCDEKKPECTRCMKHGIQCDYIFSQPKSKSKNEHSDSTASLRDRIHDYYTAPDMAASSMALSAIDQSIADITGLGNRQGDIPDHLDGSSKLVNFGYLHKFITEITELMLEPRIRVIMRTSLVNTAFSSAYLMHTILANSCLHINRMRPGNKRRELLEFFHWQRAIELYQKELSYGEIGFHNTNAIIGTCLLLTAHGVWPLGFEPRHSWVFTSNPADLNWLALQGGLRIIVKITEPYMDASFWGPSLCETNKQLEPFHKDQPGRQGLHDELADLCEIDDFTTSDTNPYHWPLQLLSRMLEEKSYNRPENFNVFVSWMGHIRPEFINILRGKDERALLLLSWWMALMCAVASFQTWIYGRIVPECKAICEYLESTSGNHTVLRLMQWPAKACGYHDWTSEAFEDVT